MEIFIVELNGENQEFLATFHCDLRINDNTGGIFCIVQQADFVAQKLIVFSKRDTVHKILL